MAEPIDRAAMRRWLFGPEVVDRDGRIRSWAPGGDAYPEAGGLWLSWLAAVEPSHPLGEAVASWLLRSIDDGRVGKDGRAYTFDLGVVVLGLLRWSGATSIPVPAALARGARALVHAVVERRALISGEATPRWSTRFGGHLRKLAGALDRIEAMGLADTAAARAILAGLVDDGAYVHAAAYAIEGAWIGRDHEALDRGTAWLAEIQRADGAIAAYWRGEAAGPGRTDATAQAVRLWCAADRVRHAAAIDRALAYLGSLQDPGGAVRYADDSAHRNVWCTLFTWQALAFAEAGAEPEALL